MYNTNVEQQKSKESSLPNFFIYLNIRINKFYSDIIIFRITFIKIASEFLQTSHF